MPDSNNSDGRDGSRRIERPDGASNDLLKSIRKEMDKLKHALKEKTTKNLDRMVKMTNSLFIPKVWNVPYHQNFACPSLSHMMV